MPNSNGSVARFENETTLRKNKAKPQKNDILRDNSTNKQVNCADPSDDKWLSFHVFPTLYVAPTWKNGRVKYFQLNTSLYLKAFQNVYGDDVVLIQVIHFIGNPTKANFEQKI